MPRARRSRISLAVWNDDRTASTRADQPGADRPHSPAERSAQSRGATRGTLPSTAWPRRKFLPTCRASCAAPSVEIAYLGPEPDRWRSPSEFALKNAQEPDHFIDLERVSWLDPLPPGRYEFYRKLYEKRAATTDHPDDYLPERVGLQPYITMEVYGRLKAAFREYRQRVASHQPTQAVQQAIIFYAGWLGHYVADGSQPLHTTIQYNGWVGPNPNGYTTQHSIHAQFETAYVAANITAKDFAGLVESPERLEDPFARYVAYLRAVERSGGKSFTRLRKPEALPERALRRRSTSPLTALPPDRRCC